MPRAIGLTDEVDTCDCCGKPDLKVTVVMDLGDGVIAYYGTTCAMRNTGKDRRTINAEIKSVEQARRAAARAEWIACPERMAYDVRLAEAHRSNVPLGIAFADFNRNARNAADAARAAIAARHSLTASQVW